MAGVTCSSLLLRRAFDGNPAQARNLRIVDPCVFSEPLVHRSAERTIGSAEKHWRGGERRRTRRICRLRLRALSLGKRS